MAPLRAVADYLYILKKAGQYNLQEQRAIPAFTYQPANTPHLEVLRKTFNLDSVAGSGNEISRILNLLHWVHNTVPHDGQHESGIKHINAADIIGTAHLKKIGVSCGELATALNECYLAMGWKARKVYCFPKDSLAVGRDSHVINMVYATTLKKWIWADPTNDAYVMNEKGELLGLEEVRQRLIRDEPLLLNPDANWNRKASTTKEAYLFTYMAKNLYRFACTLGSEYDMETPGTGKTITYVHLLPLVFSRQSPERSESHNKELGTTVINYKTNNPALFWQVPAL